MTLWTVLYVLLFAAAVGFGFCKLLDRYARRSVRRLREQELATQSAPVMRVTRAREETLADRTAIHTDAILQIADHHPDHPYVILPLDEDHYQWVWEKTHMVRRFGSAGAAAEGVSSIAVFAVRAYTPDLNKLVKEKTEPCSHKPAREIP